MTASTDAVRTRVGGRRHTRVGLVLTGLCLIAAPAAADPGDTNPNTLTRTLSCSDGRTVTATFAGLEGVNFNVSTDTGVFVFKSITIERPTGVVEVDDRGIAGFDGVSLATCTYATPSGSHVTAVGFFTPRD